MKKRKTKDQFIVDATAIHGKKYDYSKSDYINTITKIQIICKEHGPFWQLPYNHLTSKQGCPKCSSTFKITFVEFVQQSNQIHDYKFDYSLSNYINTFTKIKIICPTHGEFHQLPSSHLNGMGCSKCSTIERVSERTKSLDQFKIDAEQVHNNRYNYDKSVYVNSHTKIEIICKKHGSFLQTPDNHIGAKSGCPRCASEEASRRLVKPQEQFIEEANSKHNKEYDYSLVNYINANVKIKIKHPICGSVFEQTPSKHLDGTGCPTCANYGYHPNLPGRIYYLKFEGPTFVNFKIGITNREISQRIADFRLRSDVTVSVIYEQKFLDGNIPPILERHIKQKYKSKVNATASTFMENGYSETFTVDILSDLFDNSINSTSFNRLYETIQETNI